MGDEDPEPSWWFRTNLRAIAFVALIFCVWLAAVKLLA